MNIERHDFSTVQPRAQPDGSQRHDEHPSGRPVRWRPLGRWPLRILLAEDDSDLRAILGLILRQSGHQVFEARDGKRLLDELGRSILHAQRPPLDLVISDQRMPGRTGLDVLAGLRATDWRIPFILITAFGDREVHAEAARLGAQVIDKPFPIADLRRGIDEAIRALHPEY